MKGKHQGTYLFRVQVFYHPLEKPGTYIRVRYTANSPIETRYHELNEWIVFDDSKSHWEAIQVILKEQFLF